MEMFTSISEPIVSVCILAYNHEKYIEKALLSVLTQETTFNIEILVGEDNSTDATKSVLEELSIKYPNKFQIIYQDPKNKIFINKRPTGRYNFLDLLGRSKGKYIATLDGDDFWIDPLKLQKQVTLLENNPQYAGCFHNTAIYENDKIGLKTIINNINFNELTQSDLIETPSLFGHTSSLLFRNTFELLIPENFRLAICDRILGYLVAEKGNWVVINESMSCYRPNEGGVYAHQEKINQLFFLLGIYEAIYNDKKSKKRYKPVLKQKIAFYQREIAHEFRKRNSTKAYIKHILKYIQYERKNLRLLKIILKEEYLKNKK